jgi:hypothetical protein
VKRLQTGAIPGIVFQRWRFAAVAACFLISVSSVAAVQSSGSSLVVIQPFVGKWQGTSEGQPGSGTVTREYRLVLGDRFVEETNRTV